MSRARRIRRWVVGGAVVGGSAMLATAAISTTAAFFVRKVVTPDRRTINDVLITAVGAGTVTFSSSRQSMSPGRHGVYASDGSCHARVGAVLSEDPKTVTRELLGVDFGKLEIGPARWNKSYLVGDPQSACGVPFSDVLIESPAGSLPAWFIPADPADGLVHDTWAICVHGRAASRIECLRAVPVLHTLGYPVMIPSYRNASEGPEVGGGRFRLGDAEWEDLEAVVLHAFASGARNVVLLGWSMGAAICLQLVSRSWTAGRVTALVLDSPVVSWDTVLNHQGKLHNIPRGVVRLGKHMLGHSSAPHIVGTDAPVDLARLDWVQRAAELRLPSMIIHSDADDTVPNGPSLALAQARPDVVTYLDIPGARHTQGWNVQPDLWEQEVARFLLTVDV